MASWEDKEAAVQAQSDSAGAGRLYVVGTPIGNLGDLSPRAAEAFRAADSVLCEDTRVTGKLLAHLGISKPLVRCDENVIAARAGALVDRMATGEVFAFASDAGMPGVSDPGQVLVDAARDAGIAVEVVPGPVACVTALVASGIPCEHFFFEGFLPRKHGERVRRLRELAFVPGALLFYESPRRAADLLDEVQAREELRGECVIVVAPPSAEELAAWRAGSGAAIGAPASAEDRDAALRTDIREALAAGESVSAIAKRLSQKHSLKKRTVYELALELQES